MLTLIKSPKAVRIAVFLSDKYMSGHNKWSSIKHKKAAADAKRGKLFTKLGKLITVAAREGGDDMDTNFNLRMAVDKAKKSNMPKDNIERAIKRGTGELGGDQIESIVYEAYGPGGIAFVVETLTDNRNRTVAEIKHLFTKYGGSLGNPGSVMWMFDHKGVIRISRDNLGGKVEEIELLAIEAGADDILNEDEGVTIYTSVENFNNVKEELAEKDIEFDSDELEYIPQNTIEGDDKLKSQIEKIEEFLEDHDDVNNYFNNLA